MNSCTVNIRVANPRFQKLVDRITVSAGLHYRIQVYAADIDNACATYYKRCSSEPERPIITYDPTLIAAIESYCPWAVVALFAHEVAHHINGDLHNRYIANLFGFSYNKKFHRQELDADRFAGWILCIEGAPFNSAASLFELLDFQESYSHPGSKRRRNVLRQGWLEAYIAMHSNQRIYA